MTIRIVQLYPDALGVTGDRGNVQVLRRRAELAGLPVDVAAVGVGDDLPQADIIVIGNGPLSAMRGVVDDLGRHADALRAHVAADGALLAIGGGAELLGRDITLVDDDSITGLGVLPFRTQRRQERRVGYLVADAEHGRLAGFEDHSSVWHLEDGTAPYARVVEGKGTVELSDGTRGEGVRVSSAYALRVQGPLLPLNPAMADALLGSADPAYAPGEAHRQLDEYAGQARAAIEVRARSKTYSTIGI